MMQNISALQMRQRRGIISMIVLQLVFIFIFFINSKKVEDITFGFVVNDEWKLINEWALNPRSGAALFSLVSLLGIVISYLQFRRKNNLTLGSLIFGFGSLMSFLCWAAAGKFIPFTGLLQGAIMLSVPLIFGSMSGLLCEKIWSYKYRY